MDRRNWLTLAGSMAVCGCWGCRTSPITGRKQFIWGDEANEVVMGKQAFSQVTSEIADPTPSQYEGIVREVGYRIANASGKTDYEWEIKVVRSEEQNAFCLPGGKIVVYEGILPVCQNEAGLAVVMSHEVGHVLARHGGERMTQQSAVNGAQQVVGLITRNQAKVKQELWMKAYGAASQYGLILPYSRKHELEADHIGLMLMSQAGYDPAEAPKFWTRFSSAGKGAKPAEFASTHPSDERRASELEKLLPSAITTYRQAANPIGIGRNIMS